MERFIFSLFIFLLPTQLAFHFWPEWAFIFGIRVDYLAPTVYLTDILIGTLFIQWIFRTINQKVKSKDQKYILKSKDILVIILSMFFVATNIYFAKSPEVAVFKWIKAGEFLLLGLYIVENKKFDFTDWLAKPLAFSVIAFSLIGIAQFLVGRTLGGPFYFLGERTFNINTPGIALVTFFGREFLRPYSTFPHPNALAGFLAVALALILGSKIDSGLKLMSLLIGGLAFALSFSLGAFLAVLVAIIIFLLIKNHKKAKKIIIPAFPFGGIVISLVFAIFAREITFSSVFPESVEKRLFLAEAAKEVFSQSPILGVGLNNFFIASNSLQPVHNVFLLVLAETGIVGLLLLLYSIIKTLDHLLEIGKLDPTPSWKLEIPILVALTTGLADHYWVTLQQNQLLLVILFSLIFSKQSILGISSSREHE